MPSTTSDEIFVLDEQEAKNPLQNQESGNTLVPDSIVNTNELEKAENTSFLIKEEEQSKMSNKHKGKLLLARTIQVLLAFAGCLSVISIHGLNPLNTFYFTTLIIIILISIFFALLQNYPIYESIYDVLFWLVCCGQIVTSSLILVGTNDGEGCITTTTTTTTIIIAGEGEENVCVAMVSAIVFACLNMLSFLVTLVLNILRLQQTTCKEISGKDNKEPGMADMINMIPL